MGLMKMAFRRVRKLVAWLLAISIILLGIGLFAYVATTLGWLG